MIKLAMTGGAGRVGRYMENWGVEPLVCDVTNPNDTLDRITRSKPNIILHLAAKSDIEYCENPDNHKKVTDVNLKGTFNVLSAADTIGAKVVMLSSDHVFSGGGFLKKYGPYRENDSVSPVNFYGHSKLAAEGLVKAFDNFKIVRTSYLFDANRIETQSRVQPTFIRRSFMYLPHFASVLFQYLQNYDRMPTILHIAGSKTVSWYKFMSAIYKDVEPRRTEKPGAPRPYYAGLKSNYNFFMPYSYLDGIREMLK